MSEIRVDTISEKTSANGVAIDGVTIKDGGISATTQLDVQQSTTDMVGLSILNTNNSATTTSSQLRIGMTNSVGASYAVMKVQEGGSDDYPDIIFGVQNAVTTTPTERMRIKDTGQVGIGTNAPAKTLHISSADNQPLRVESTDAYSGVELKDNGASTLPPLISGLSDGFKIYAGHGSSRPEVMSIDATGAVTKPLQPAFLVHPASAQTNIADGATIVFGTERFDLGGDFASNTFTAPVTGKYQINFTARIDAIDTDASHIRIYFISSNKTYEIIKDPNYTADLLYSLWNFCALIDMDASDTLHLEYDQNVGTEQVDFQSQSFFSGYLVC